MEEGRRREDEAAAKILEGLEGPEKARYAGLAVAGLTEFLIRMKATPLIGSDGPDRVAHLTSDGFSLLGVILSRVMTTLAAQKDSARGNTPQLCAGCVAAALTKGVVESLRLMSGSDRETTLHLISLVSDRLTSLLEDGDKIFDDDDDDEEGRHVHH